MRIVELFCGIGGCAAALADRGQVVAAVDVNPKAIAVYQHNFPHPAYVRTIESLPSATLAAWQGECWWMSPPCQPYTRRGKQLDLADPRALSLLTLIGQIGELRPRYIALENVPGFEESQVRGRLESQLRRCGYNIKTWSLCPTQFGLPNRRRRFYLVAGQGELISLHLPSASAITVADVLDAQPADDLWLETAYAMRHAGTIHTVDSHDPAAVANCFTAGYGYTSVRSGSCLETSEGPRRFSEQEILRLLGFPSAFRFPPTIRRRDALCLLGNSVSVPVVRYVLSSIPGIADE
jgi:site-specific DNA-cytosine methylase